MGAIDMTQGSLRPGSPVLTRTLERAKALLVGRATTSFRDQARAGNAWAPRAVPNLPGILADLARGPRVKEDRWRERPAGKDTGRLVGSIFGEITGGDAIVFGSRLEYASRFQRGEVGPPITITATMRDNLVRYLKSERRRAGRAAVPGMVGAQSRADKLGWLLAATKNKSGRSYTYKTQAITTKPRARPFVVITDQDRADVRSILVTEFRRGLRDRRGR